MPRLTSFADAFWGSGFTSTEGFDVLVQRMVDGKKQSKELEEYLRQRSKIEFSYSQELTKLYKSIKMKEVVGTLEKTWNTLKGEVENMAECHSKAAISFQKQSEELKKFSDGHNAKKKQLEEHVKKYQHNKNSQYNKCMNNKKNYNQKCQDRDAARSQFEASRQSVTITAKELDKSRLKMEKSEDDKTKADLAYQSSLDALEHSRIEWEKEMESACQTFQTLEEERISYMREDIWKSTNIDSLTAVQVDTSCENIRLVLKNCEIGEDISLFIDKYKTGKERPAKIEYEDYYANTSLDYNSKQNTHRYNRSQQPLPSSVSPTYPVSAPTAPTQPQHLVRPAPPRSRPPDSAIFSLEDPTYSTIASNARIMPDSGNIEPEDDGGLYQTLEKREDTGAVVSPLSYSERL